MNSIPYHDIRLAPSSRQTTVKKGPLENAFPLSPAITLNSDSINNNRNGEDDDDYYRQINNEINQTNIRSDLQSIMTKSTSKSRLTNNSIRGENVQPVDRRPQMLQSALNKKQGKSSRYSTPRNTDVASPRTSDYQSAKSTPENSGNISERSEDNLSKRFFKSFEQLDKSNRGSNRYSNILEVPNESNLESGAERYFTHLSNKYDVSKEDLLSLVTNELIDDADNLKSGSISDKYNRPQEFVKSPIYDEPINANNKNMYYKNPSPIDHDIGSNYTGRKDYPQSPGHRSSGRSTPKIQGTGSPIVGNSIIDIEALIEKVRLETLEDARREFQKELEAYQRTKEVEDSALTQAMITAKIQARLQSKLEKEVKLLAELRKDVEDEILKKYDKSYWGWQYKPPPEAKKEEKPKENKPKENKPKDPIKVYEFESTNAIPFVFPFDTVKTWPLFLGNLKEAYPEHKNKILENNLKLYSKINNVRILPSHWEHTLAPGMEIEVEFPKEKHKKQSSRSFDPYMLMPPNMNMKKNNMFFDPIGLPSLKPQLLPPDSDQDSNDVSSTASSGQMKQPTQYQRGPYPRQNNNGLLSKTLKWFTETERNPQYRMPMQHYNQKAHPHYDNDYAEDENISPYEEAAALKDPEL